MDIDDKLIAIIAIAVLGGVSMIVMKADASSIVIGCVTAIGALATGGKSFTTNGKVKKKDEVNPT